MMDIDGRLYSEQSDEELQAGLAANQKKRVMHQRKLTQYQTFSKNIQAELDRRGLAAYWSMHPELMPVAVGDKVVVTQDFIDHKEAVVGQGYAYTLGEVYTLQSINGVGNCVIEQVSSVTGCPIPIVCNMRRAYLEREAEGSE